MQYYDSSDTNASAMLGITLKNIIDEEIFPSQELIILCIGSDRSTGDSLGPLVGYRLKQTMQCGFYVYGDLMHPVHAGNLTTYIDNIYRTFDNPYIVAIDASLGKPEHIGLITLSKGPLRPGLGVKKKLPEVGDVHITGIVNISSDSGHSILQTTRLSTTFRIADTIFNALNYLLISDIDISDDFYKLQLPEKLYLQPLTS